MIAILDKIPAEHSESFLTACTEISNVLKKIVKDTQVKPDVELHLSVIMEPDLSAGGEPDLGAGVEPDLSAGVEPDLSAGVEPDLSAGVEPDTSAITEPDPGAAVEPELSGVVEPDTSAGPEPDNIGIGNSTVLEPERSVVGKPGAILAPECQIKSSQIKYRQTCRYYKWGICKYGISGRTNGRCQYDHPKKCRILLSTGKCTESCDFFHPELCKNSLNMNECFNTKCPAFHIKGTRRIRQIDHLDESSHNSVYQNDDFLARGGGEEWTRMSRLYHQLGQMLERTQTQWPPYQSLRY